MRVGITTFLFLVACATAAHAQYTITAAGPVPSAGPRLGGLGGGAGNGLIDDVYGGPSVLLGSLAVQGDLTAVNTATFGNEASFEVGNTSIGAFFLEFPVDPAIEEFPGTLAVAASFNNRYLYWTEPGDAFQIEAFETFNDAGLDANWTNLKFDFTLPAIVDLGDQPQGMIDLTTIGSTFDTELAIYDAVTGTLLGTNDDIDVGAGNLASQVAGTITPGEYILVVGGFDSLFGNFAALPGTEVGDFVLNLNGTTVGEGPLGRVEFAVFSMTVVPEPSTWTLAALAGLLVAARARRRR